MCHNCIALLSAIIEVLEKTVSVKKTILYKMAVWFNRIVFVHFIILGKGFVYLNWVYSYHRKFGKHF